MKIAFIISSLGSGGAERVLSLLANYFSNNNEIYIITLSNEDSFYNLNKNIKHIKLNLFKKSKNKIETIINSTKRILILKKTLKQIDADVNISFMTPVNMLSIISSKINKQKIIVSERTAFHFSGKLKNIFYRFSDYFVTQTKADLKNYNLKKKTYIYNPFIFIDKEIKKEKIVLAVGRLEKEKRFDRLIEVFNKIDTDWQLWIIGDGSLKEELNSLIKKDNIKLLGKKKNIFDYYAKASIFVLSSEIEGFPNVLIEAMAYKCAVVSYDCLYGPSEIIENNKNGILVNNKQQLKESIELLIENKKLREKLANEAIKVREKYSIEKIAKEWENVIKEVING